MKLSNTMGAVLFDKPNVLDFSALVRMAIVAGVELVNADFGERSIGDVNFTDLDLSQANFDKSKLDRVTFSKCNLQYARFIKAALQGVAFDECNLCRTEMRQSRVYHCEFNNCNLSSIRFDKSTLFANEFVNCIMDDAEFGDSELDNTRFIKSSMKFVSLALTRIIFSSFTDCSMLFARMDDIIHTKSLFERCVLGGDMLAKAITTTRFNDCYMHIGGLRFKIHGNLMITGPVGSRGDMLRAVDSEKGVIFGTGCFIGHRLNLLEKAKDTHGEDSMHYRKYELITRMAEELLK